MSQNVHSRNRKSDFQFDVASKSDLSNHSAPSSKWLAQCDVHKLTLQINMEKEDREKESKMRRGRTSLRYEQIIFAALAKSNQENLGIRDGCE